MKDFKIAGITLNNPFVSAPLAGYTDYAMRKMCADYGSALTYTEMESCESLYYSSKQTYLDLDATKLDKQNTKAKLALQIFGGKSDIVLKSIPLFEKNGAYDFLDFNVGCPVPKVVKQNAGSAWLNRPEELISLLKEMVKISSKPVIVKIRIGFDHFMDIVSLCKQMEEVGVQAIAVHGRLRSEYFMGSVHYDVIKDIKNSLSIPVIANGNICETNFQDVLNATGADAVMIGQRAIGYPKVFEDMNRLWNGEKPLPTTISSQIQDFKKHLDLIFDTKDEHSASSIMRSFAVNYIKGFDNVKKYRAQLVHCETKQEYLDILNNMQSEQTLK